MAFTFRKTKTPLCSFYHSYHETIKHIFLECICVNKLWNHLRLFLTNDIFVLIERRKPRFLAFLLTELKTIFMKLQITYFQSLKYTSTKIENEVWS